MNKLTAEQFNFLEDYVEGTWTQNIDFSVSVKGNINFFNRKLKLIPVQFKEVSGNFCCAHNQLTSLENSPFIVLGDFWCSDNKLISLKHCPREIQGNLDCYNNQLISLEYCPSTVSGDFSFNNNPVSEKTLKLLFQARTAQKLSWPAALASCYSKIPQEDLKVLDLPKDFKEKYRGNIAASNLGLI